MEVIILVLYTVSLKRIYLILLSNSVSSEAKNLTITIVSNHSAVLGEAYRWFYLSHTTFFNRLPRSLQFSLLLYLTLAAMPLEASSGI